MHNESSAMVTVNTARLRLTPVSTADIDVLHAMWIDPDVRRYLWDDVVIDRTTVEEVVGQNARDWSERRYGFWLIVDAESGDVAGFIGFRSSGDTPAPELLYGLLPRFWGRGFATEAARAAVRYAFETLGLDAVHAATDVPNVASMQVMERLGMTFVRRDANMVFYRLDSPQ